MDSRDAREEEQQQQQETQPMTEPIPKPGAGDHPQLDGPLPKDLLKGLTLGVLFNTFNVLTMKPSDLTPLPYPHNPPSSTSFSSAIPSKRHPGTALPQAIAHRGYKAAHPENTLNAFRGACSIGAHALETDIHLTSDDVVVLSHDATMLRCFGKDMKIKDHTWAELSELRTLEAPHEPMPRLADLLAFMATKEASHLWIMLDIKIDNDAARVMSLIAQTLAVAPPSPSKPWTQRVLLGIWTMHYLAPAQRFLPTYPLLYIGFSMPLARQFLQVPDVSFSLLQRALAFPPGKKFLRDAKADGRQVYSWTVNDPRSMRWGIRHGLDGVITDDPKTFLEVCEDWDPERDAVDERVAMREWVFRLWIHLMASLWGILFGIRHGRGVPIVAARGKGIVVGGTVGRVKA